MMISQEVYYEKYLKGKTKGQIMTAMRGLKQEIVRLKDTMESPDYGGYFGGHRSYVVELSDDIRVYTKLWEDEEPLLLLDDDNKEHYKKDTFVVALKNLHIGEWHRRYSTKRFGYVVCDGTQWELEFEYNNGNKPVRFVGDNSYPYNFDKFKMLFGIYDTGEDENE